jgi:hypothetical protein
MGAVARPLPRAPAIALPAWVDFPALSAFTLGFAPVLYLALRGGGYDPIVYSEVGLVAWWLVLLGAVAGVMPLARFGRLAWVTAGLLGAFVLWTAIASGWSESSERTIDVLGRVATYLGLFVLSLCVLRRDAIRALLTGVGAAFVLVSLLAVLSRLYPGAFPADQAVTVFGSNPRLDYPLNYSDGTGNFLAMGLPVLLGVASRRRWVVVQALATAAVPIAALGLVMTASRGGVLTAIVGIVVFYALAPDRLPKLATGVVSAAGSAILIVGFLHRHAVRNALSGSLAVSQRHQLTVLLVVVCTGIALLQVAIGLASRYGVRPRALLVSRSRAAQLAAAGLVITVIAAVAAGVPGKLAHQWDVFKRTDVTGVVSGDAYTRLGTISGSHRYQYWQAAFYAFKSKPLTGIGPGTFEFYWAQHGSFYEFVRNAHSLYLETLAEDGAIGLAVLAAFLLTLLGAGVWRSLRAPPRARATLAAATATVAAFGVAAATDWMWQLACAPAAALLAGGAIVSYGVQERTGGRRSGWAISRWISSTWATRGMIAAAATAAIIAIAIPFATTSAIRSSQAAARIGNVNSALSDALTAQRLEPDAATPRLQRALLFEQAHDYGAARAPAAEAAVREPTNWSVWVVKARIDAESGHPRAAVADYRRAHALNPHSPATAE